MADATHDMDEGFHEIHLSGKQLVFLFMATTVVSVVIFLCGVLVGRGVQAQQSQESLADPAPLTAVPASSAPVAEAGPPAAEPPAPPEEVDALTYKRRLEGDAPPESLKPPPSAPATPPPAARTTPRTAAPPPAAEPPATAPAPQPGTWIVQVNALRDRNVANGIVQRLVAKGYPAFLSSAGSSGIYRVQVGRFKDRREAERTLDRLTREEQFKPWITR